VATGTPSLNIAGSAGGWLSDLASAALDDGTLGAYPVGATDVLAPVGDGASVLRYGGTELGAGVTSRPNGQVLFLGMPFEGITSARGRGQVVGAFLSHVLGTPTPPLLPADVVSPVSPRPLSGCVAARAVDPHPAPPPPPPPPPEPRVVSLLPQFYYGKADTGCGCEAGEAGTASGLWLLLGLSVQRRRARARTPHAKR
jgi:hypothetical protein